MGLLDLIARNLAYTTDSSIAINPFQQQPYDEAAATMHRVAAAASADVPVVLDPTIRAVYLERPALVERDGFDEVPLSSRAAHKARLKEILVRTHHTTPGGVRFVGDRSQWRRAGGGAAGAAATEFSDAYDSDEDGAQSVYRAMEEDAMTSEYNHHRHSARSITSDGDRDDEHYAQLAHRLQAPALVMNQYTHVHRCVGTEDLVSSSDYSRGSFLRKGSYSYHRGGSAHEGPALHAVVGHRLLILYASLGALFLIFTLAAWLYVAYLRYYFSGDDAFATDRRRTQNGIHPTYFANRTINGTVRTVELNDTSTIFYDGAWVRTKSLEPVLLLVPPATAGSIYLATTTAGLVFALLVALRACCWVNVLRYRPNVRFVMGLHEESQARRAAAKDSTEMQILRDGGNEAAPSPFQQYGGQGSVAPRRGGGMGMGMGGHHRTVSEGAESVASFVSSRWGGGGAFGSLGNGGNGNHPHAAVPPIHRREWALQQRIVFDASAAEALDSDKTLKDPASDLDFGVERRGGWLEPLVAMPIPLTDVLLANPHKERKRAMGIAKAIVGPAIILLVPLVVVMLGATMDALDRYAKSLVAYTTGPAPPLTWIATILIPLFTFLPIYGAYHKEALKYVMHRYQ